MTARGAFVTGTDTGIGKTFASCVLLAAWRTRGVRAAGMKPVASGSRMTRNGLRNEDAEALIAASDPAPAYADCNPFAFAEPIAPHIAARLRGVEINLEPVLSAYARIADLGDHVVVEGVGGWAVPFSDSLMQADLVRALQLPVILVVGLRLGCLNHALLSARTIESDGCKIAGWIANRIDPAMEHADANIATLRKRIAAPLLGALDYVADAGQDRLAAALDLSPLQ